MIHNDGKKRVQHQSGLALLVLSILIALTISAYYFNNISITKVEIEKSNTTRTVLAEAKQALIAYAVSNWHTENNAGLMGVLPCPDYQLAGEEGEQNTACGSAYANAIGKFPWRTLDIDVTRSSDGECLYYAVSPGYKAAPAAALNTDSFGQFQIVDSVGAVVQGGTPETRPVAVIFAAGKALDGQARNHNPASRCGEDYENVAAYLDSNGITDNAAIDTATENVIEQLVAKFEGSEEAANPLNDAIITITNEEIWTALEPTITDIQFQTKMHLLTEAVAMCFASYGNANTKKLPMPAPRVLAEYRRNGDYDDAGNFTTAFAGRLPYNVNSSNAETLGGNTQNIFDNAFCDNLTISNGDDINFTDDSGDDAGEFFDLWQNWKDHFFYVVSEAYKPDSASATCGDCVEYKGTKYAALIFFSGIEPTVRRYAPPFEANQKDDIARYLEENRDTIFPDNDGDGVYPDITAGNDFIVCIKEDMSIELC